MYICMHAIKHRFKGLKENTAKYFPDLRVNEVVKQKEENIENISLFF